MKNRSPATSAVTRRHLVLALSAVSIAAGIGLAMPSATASEARMVPAFAGTAGTAAHESATSEAAILAGGCFWGVQGVFQHVKGVSSAVSGYAGGDQRSASYDAVGSGATRHAEAVRVIFDPRQISYAQILQIYFSVAHDPTQLNRQVPDRGPQYRSTIFPISAEQARIARAYIAQFDAAKAFPRSIATTIEPDRAFYAAEDYHQDFLVRNPRHPYIVYNDLPKIEDLKRLFPGAYRPDPVLVSGARKAG